MRIVVALVLGFFLSASANPFGPDSTVLSVGNGGTLTYGVRSFVFNGNAISITNGTALIQPNTVSGSGLGDIINGGNTTGASLIIGTNDAQSLLFETNNTTRMTVSSAGNVGIAAASPAAALDVSSGNVSLLLGADNTSTTRTNSTQKNARIASAHYLNAEEPMAGLMLESTSTNNIIYVGGGTAFMNAATQIGFYTAATYNTTTGTERMRINSDGNVGIGTATPAQKFTVVNSGAFEARFDNTSTGDAVVAIDRQSSGAQSELQFHDAGAVKWVLADQSTTNDFIINEDDTNMRFKVQEGGNVGIGVDTPSAVLHISGDARIGNGSIIFDAQASNYLTTGSEPAIYGTGTTFNGVASTMFGSLALQSRPDGGDRPILFITGDTPTERMRVDGNGDVGIGTKTPATPFEFKTLTADPVLRLSNNGGVAYKPSVSLWRSSSDNVEIEFSPGGGGLELVLNRATTAAERVLTVFDNGNISVLEIKGNGNTGIGDNTPSAKLEVNGTLAIEEGTGAAAAVTGAGVFKAASNGDLFYTSSGGTVTNLISGGGVTGLNGLTDAVNTASGIAIGLSALNGVNNTSIGAFAGVYGIGAEYNVNVGYQSGAGITTGDYNVSIGPESMERTATGSYNVAIGLRAMEGGTTGTTSGGENVSVGNSSMRNVDAGSQNVSIGAGVAHDLTDANQNTAVGYLAMEKNILGNGNVAVGRYAARFVADGTTGLTDTSNGVYLGGSTKALANTSNNEIVIGYNATGNGSNTAVIGNDSITHTMLKGNVGIKTKASCPAEAADPAFGLLCADTNGSLFYINSSGTLSKLN